MNYYLFLQMEEQYDKLADTYTLGCKDAPYRIFVLRPSFINFLGDIKEKTILDIGCGDGVNTQKLVDLQPSKIVGIDISSGMIAKAREDAEEKGYNIDYLVSDCAQVQKFGDFDIVFSCYLLNQMSTKEELVNICKCIKMNLKEGGKFVGITHNCATESKYMNYKKHGLHFSRPDDPKDGDVVNFSITFNNQNLQLKTYYMKPETIERAFREAGFSHFEWKQMILKEEKEEKEEREVKEYFSDIMLHPFDIGIVAYC